MIVKSNLRPLKEIFDSSRSIATRAGDFTPVLCIPSQKHNRGL